MTQEYRKLIKYNELIKINLENRFVYSSFKKKLKRFYFRLSRIVLFFLKISAIILNPFLKKIDTEECDILVFSNSKNHLKRSINLWKVLEKKGYKILYYNKKNNYLTQFIFKYKIDFDIKVPYKLFFHHAFAKYLTQKYKFKLLCDYHNFEVTSALIKRELNVGQKNIFIPHGKIRNSYRHSCFSFDYYLVFGESSIEKIFENPLRLGDTRLVKTGSVFIPPDFCLDVCTNFKNVLFFSNWAVSYHPESKRGFEIVKKWAEKNPEFNLYIRLHPLEEGTYVIEQTKDIPNVFVQDKSLSLKESLENVSLTIATASNASIEAALLKRPSLLALDRDYDPESDDVYESDNNFFIESYFPQRARNEDQLDERVKHVFENYDHYIEQCKKYVSYHLEHTTDATEFTAKVIDKIFINDEDIPFIDVKENIEF